MRNILETDRLYLRELATSDYTDLCEIFQDKETMYTYEHAFSDNEVTEMLNKQFWRYKNEGYGLWGVLLRENNDFLGVCGITIQNINDKEYLEIGYMFKRKHWQNGYATEAATGCKHYAFDILKAKCVYSIMRDNNIPSQNVAKRLGMRKIDEVVKHYYGLDMVHFVFWVENRG